MTESATTVVGNSMRTMSALMTNVDVRKQILGDVPELSDLGQLVIGMFTDDFKADWRRVTKK